MFLFQEKIYLSEMKMVVFVPTLAAIKKIKVKSDGWIFFPQFRQFHFLKLNVTSNCNFPGEL